MFEGYHGGPLMNPLARIQEKERTMKTFAVQTGLRKPTIYVRTGDAVEIFIFNTKRQADKKILALLEQGYTFDPTHETVNDILLAKWRDEHAGRYATMPMDDEDENA